MTVLTLMLLAAAPAARAIAQTPASAPAVEERDARDTKERLRAIFDQYPPSVAQVLRIDPSLIARPDYLAAYPTLAAFLAQHPEVAHNPVFFLGGANGAWQSESNRSGVANAVENIFVGLEVAIGVMFGIGTLAWLLRSAIDYRRWLRAMKIQTDAHTKIVDRLASNEDLLAYMQSPLGQRFLTASPMAPPIGQLGQPMGAPLNRILWSVQAGVVLTMAGAGLWLAKSGIVDEAGQAMQVLAILAMALGIGFVLSALASYGLSRQLGLVNSPADHA